MLYYRNNFRIVFEFINIKEHKAVTLIWKGTTVQRSFEWRLRSVREPKVFSADDWSGRPRLDVAGNGFTSGPTGRDLLWAHSGCLRKDLWGRRCRGSFQWEGDRPRWPVGPTITACRWLGHSSGGGWGSVNHPGLTFSRLGAPTTSLFTQVDPHLMQRSIRVQVPA